MTPSRPSHTTICGATIDGKGSTVIRGADLISCTMKNIQLHSCAVSGSTLNKCQLSNCVIKNSSLLDSTLHVSKIISCSLDDCSVTRAPLSFRKFPPEIRAAIFAYCLDWVSSEDTRVRKTPVLLVALRGDPELYPEAIDLFYKQNCFRVNLENFDDCNSMSKNVLEKITNLKIRYESSSYLL